MEVNELRIGNLVGVNDLFITVNRIEGDKFWATHRDLLFFSGTETSPIPLTEDWLVKLGFEKDGNSFIGHHKFCPVLEFCDGGFYDTFESCQTSRIFKYVHDFQNYFYATTGEELTIVE